MEKSVDVDRALERHREEMLQRLDAWFLRVECMLQEQLRRPTSEGITQSRGLTTFERVTSRSEQNSELSELGSADLAHMARSMNQRAATAEVGSEDSEVPTGFRLLQYRARKVVTSQWSNAFFALVVLTNSLYLGVQLEYHAVVRDDRADHIFLGIHLVYALLFTFEVALRLLGDGCWHFVCSSEWAWNCLDMFIVCSSWVELAVDVLTPGTPGTLNRGTNTNLRLIRLLRVGRLFRVVRIIRVVRVFRALRTLVQSLVGTLKTLFWALLLLLLIMYIFGILFTDAVLDHVILAGTEGEMDAELLRCNEYFGTLQKSMTTLFRTISDGITWNVSADSLLEIQFGQVWVQLYHFYVAFCSFAVLNVMTGVFCNSAIKAAESDHEMVVQTLVQTRQELKDLVTILFSQIDKQGKGKITFGEFETFFEDEAVKAFFESLQIGAMDAWTLFVSLDMDGDSQVSVEEFTERCMQLHGPARSADLFALRQQNVKMARQLQKLESNLRQVKRATEDPKGFSA